MNHILKPKNHLIGSLCSQSTKCLSTFSLQKSNISHNHNYELSLIACLKDCAKNLSIFNGQELHGLILKSGLDYNIFVQNSLINFYAKCGLIYEAKRAFDAGTRLDFVSYNVMICGFVRLGYLNEARQLFDRMTNRDCVSYTTMIMALVQRGFWIEAVGVFEAMRVAGVVPNDVTMSSVVTAYARYDVVGEIGGMLHGLVMKLGLDVFVIVGTNLVHLYCLGGKLGNAKRLFDEMPEKNLVTRNVMLNGYAKAGEVELANKLFQGIEDKDVVSWGTIINCYVQAGRLTEALKIYLEMVGSGLGPNEVMIVDIISACGQAMSLSLGQQFHGMVVRRGFDCYDFIQATIICFYAACRKIDLSCLQFELARKDHLPSWNALLAGLIRSGRIDQARRLFFEIPERDIFSWSTMISGYSQTGQAALALELFHEMVANGVRPNEVTMVSVLSAVAALGSLKDARWAHEYLFVNSIPLNDNLSAAIIDMYAKCGSISSALEVFHRIREKAKDISPWNAIICGSARHGHAEMALSIFDDLQKLKMKPNAITFVGVLSACCHGGLVEVGEKHFENMKSLYGIEPNIKHYGCMIDLLGRAGRLEEAERLIHGMPMKADVIIWGTLMAACRTHGNSELGERAAKNLAMVEPSHGPSRVLLSNIYAEAGRWDDALVVRRTIEDQQLTRTPAYSGVA
ncbi:hypothetical protein LIER_30904 [Lithospermum erythrorhizon]|uniref:Pentatricopeptide repeat-containing protein n=1 Tax=Lithospermum erythrorhizon TaxID=34254 RepID=A0AAV3RSY0_LITER